MSGRIGILLASWAATLLASASLLPLVDRSTWLVQAAILLGLTAGAGAAARRVPLARPLTAGSQLLAGALLLTLLFAREEAFLGFLPTPDSVRELGTLIGNGVQDVGRFASPAPLTDGIALLLVGGVLLVGLLVDTFAVTYRLAAPAGLPLLALYSVAAGLSDGGAGALWFALAGGGYLVLLLAESGDRLARWGRVFGGPVGGGSAPRESVGTPATPMRSGRRIGAVALGVALVVPLVLPSLGTGLLGTAGPGPGGEGGGGTISAVNPLVSLQNSLNQPENREVLKYRTNAAETDGLYLRIVSLDDFDGVSWKPASRPVTDVPGRLPPPPGLAGDTVPVTEVSTNVSAAGWYAQDWLPMPYPATRVEVPGDWRFEPVGRTLVGDGDQDTRGLEYSVDSLLVRPGADQLAVADSAAAAQTLPDEFSSVPDSLPAVVERTARKVTRGADNDYERAVRLQDWFAQEGGFTYDTQVRAGSGSQAIARFLRDKEGFCVHFSFAMASMARTLGMPSRVAVGFTAGTAKSSGEMSVGLRDAHAWPELFFEGIGWTRFEPTPNRGSVPEYTRPDVPDSEVDTPEQPEESASDAPSTPPSDAPSCPRAERALGECGPDAPDAGAAGGGGGPPWGTLLGTAGALLLLAAALLGPLVWRRRVRGLRLTPVGDGAGPRGVPPLAAWRELTDTAWDHGIAPDGALTPRRAAERLVALAEPGPETAEGVRRLAGAVERELYAPRPAPVAGLAEDVERFRAALHARASRRTRLRALLLPRSAVRVAWAAADHGERLRARGRAAAGRLPRLPRLRGRDARSS
ncbi:transglutaminase TgpA family protein [Streptomyces sp. BBFR102]|uniref:transglutaminase TgpA family protein n=1 Tax=Streptomyces sp. BBFR102 TaxID=3448171 RepID=UPI003F535E2F